MYVPILGFLLINRALAGLPSKIVEELLVNGIIYISWNAIKITYQGLTYTIYSAYKYSVSPSTTENQIANYSIPLLEYNPNSSINEGWIDDFIEIDEKSIN
tara:strand:- start:39 stop:341 length:303 start_codon:yes stop_codon:yes gene_type:complete